MAQTTVANGSTLLVVRTAQNDNATDAESRIGANETGKADKVLEIDNTSTGAYTLVAADNGKLVKIDAGLIIPTGLAIGFQCSVFLDNATKQTLTTTGITVKGNDQAASISGNGILSIAIILTNTALIAGEMEA